MTLEVVLYLDCIRRQLGTVILALTKVWQSGVKQNLDSPSQYAKTLNMADSWYSWEWDENGWGKHHGVNPGLSSCYSSHTCSVETEGTSCTSNHTETVQLRKVV